MGLGEPTREVEIVLNGIVRISLIEKGRNEQSPEKMKNLLETVLWLTGNGSC